jgi:rfaE bifunctional protein kinase chain/domain
MLTDASLDRILACIPRLRVGVLGDIFLDRYFDIDAALSEPSLETRLDAYQVVRVRCYPGAAGTVINNLAALGVPEICAVSVIGDDGEGFELRRALHTLPVVTDGVLSVSHRRTPTYTKPMLSQAGASSQELNRLDIKNRSALPAAVEDQVLEALAAVWPRVDVLLVLDQVSEPECGVVTRRVRERLAELGTAETERVILADSRERIGLFRSVWLKPNRVECFKAVGAAADGEAIAGIVEALARRAGRPVFCTCGERGIVTVDPRPTPSLKVLVPAFPVKGPIDPVGAGDSTSAAIACALAGGATLEEAAEFGNLVASITIQQLGTTGTASPAQIRQRWCEVGGG